LLIFPGHHHIQRQAIQANNPKITYFTASLNHKYPITNFLSAPMTSVEFPNPFQGWHNDIYPAIDPTRPELSAKGKSVVITGGGSGIGPQIARPFAIAGAKDIGIIGRRKNSLGNKAET
jgi:hypothetical protein